MLSTLFVYHIMRILCLQCCYQPVVNTFIVNMLSVIHIKSLIRNITLNFFFDFNLLLGKCFMSLLHSYSLH